MSEARLESFVSEALRAGVERGEIERVLLEAGWARDKVASALSDFSPLEFAVPVPSPRVNVSARDACLYLLLFGTLYYGAFHLIDLIFQFINLGLPDPAIDDPQQIARQIRWSTSVLLVTAPVFLFLDWRIARMIRSDPVQRASGVRKWLTYLTLAYAAAVVIGDVVYLVNSLLSGELTGRVLLKGFTIGAVAGSVFWRYFRSVRADDEALSA